jgi:hypothetical protein
VSLIYPANAFFGKPTFEFYDNFISSPFGPFSGTTPRWTNTRTAEAGPGKAQEQKS